MAKIIIYTSNRCSYCMMAKRLLDKKSITYSEINIHSESGLLEEMIKKSKRRTVPQIFIDDLHIGGFDDLYALELKKELDKLL